MLSLLSMTEAATQIRDGRISPGDLVDCCVDQIRRHDAKVRAWVVVDEHSARREAEILAKEAKAGQFRGPLHGLPIGVKDIIDVAGFPTRAGSSTRDDRLARSDAPLVAALRRAGAIVLGKTVTVEFACFDPSPTRNPWDPALEHSPGGSSSGSAAAVAAGMCLGAVGTQTGGSLVRPATFCGIAACRPTFGTLSTEGVVPVSYHLDQPGPMGRTASDLERMLDVMAGLPHREALEMPTAPRLGFVEPFFMERADPPVADATREAVEKLRARGAVIEPVALAENFPHVLAMHWLVMAVEAAAYHREAFAACRSQYGPMISKLLDEGLTISAVDYADALAHQRHFQRQIVDGFEGFDALVCPATDTTAPPTLATTGKRDFQAPWSYAGVPVVSIPCALAFNGLPVGLQLVGRPHTESHLFRVARWCESVLEFREYPPILV